MVAQPQTIDEYIRAFPEDAQHVLETLRQAIRKAAPKATESVSYKMPTFKLDGQPLVYFAGWKKHVSLYPITDAMRRSMKEIAAYKSLGVTIQFPLGEPLPLSLIKKIVKQRIRDVRSPEKKC